MKTYLSKLIFQIEHRGQRQTLIFNIVFFNLFIMSSGQESPSYAKDSTPDILGKDTNEVFSKLHDTFSKFFQWVLGQPHEG